MQEYSRDDLVFDVTDTGPAGGEVVVLLHGFPENRSSWGAVIPLVTAAGHRVLAPDQRGYSPRARPRGRRDYRMDELVADTLALVDASGAERVHLVGHDWGGAVAWAFAHAHPDRLHTMTSLTTPHPRALAAAMVRSTQLLHSWYMLFFQLPALPELGYSARGIATTRRALIRTGLSADAADRYLEPMRQPGAARAAINWYRAMPFNRWGIGEVTVPALYVYATRDRFLGRRAAELTGRYVDAPYRFEELDASHWLPEDEPDLVAKLVLDHVASHRAS